MKDKIETKAQLVAFVINKSEFYKNILHIEQGALISKYYLTDFIHDLQDIQEFLELEK